MVDDELPPNEGADPVVPPGPRRSTYTPPPSGASYEPTATDDDALAGALSQEFQRWVPPTGPIVPPFGAVVADEPVPAPVPEPLAMPSPGQLPPPPQRISLTDEQLLAAADLDAPEHDTGALLDLVERELELRQTEARRLAEWEQQVRAASVPEAEAEEIVSRVKAQFTGVIPVIPVTPSVSEQLAAAPPPASAPAPAVPPTAPAIDLALADAPPPYGMVPSAVTPPPPVPAPASSISLESPPSPAPDSPPAPNSPTSPDSPTSGAVPVPPLVEPGPLAPVALDAAAPSATALLFDDLLRAPESPAAPVEHPDAETSPAAAPTPDALDEHSEAAGRSGDELSAIFGGAAVVPEVAAPTTGPPAATSAIVPPSAGRVEVNALEPTPAEQRAGRSVRLFWLWFAVNASVVSVGLGAVVVGLGVSLRQAVLATLIGVAVSFLPLGLGTLAGKWSGQPTMVVSRATFGIVGNLLPALLALVTRLAWAAALLWMLATGVAEVLVGSGLAVGLGRLELTLAVAGLGLVLAAVIAGIGFGMIALVSAIVSALSAVLVTGLIVLTASRVDLDAALSVPDGDWTHLLGGAVLVFSVVGLTWANSSGDLARYQAKGTYGSSAVLFTAFGATIPAFALICWGALLAASNPDFAAALQSNPVGAIAGLLPLWYPAPLLAAVALSLICAAALALYSGGFALLASGLRAPRSVGVVVTVVLSGALAAMLIAVVPDAASLFRDVVTTLAVPVAAWAGIFGAETMIRTRRVHSPSLLRSGGVYPAVRWGNLIMFLVITGLGWGLSTAAILGLQWQGYLFVLLGADAAAPLAASDPGVLVALLLGLLTPLVVGIPALRRLQASERAAADADTAATAVVAEPTSTTAVPTA